MIRAAALLLAWFAFLIGAIAMAARYVPVVNHAVLFVSAFAPYLAIGGSAVSALLLLMIRRPGLAAIPIALAVAAVAVQLPLFTGSTSGSTAKLRVFTVNAKEGAAEPDTLAVAAREQTDLLAVQELTAELAGEVSERLGDAFPFRALSPGKGADGTGIWSRYPIVSSQRIPGYRLGAVSTTVRVPGAASDAVVVCLHVVGPWPHPIDGWRQEMAGLPQTLQQTARAAGPGATIVVGDFNATRDMAPFRNLLSGGYRDAAEQSGSGLTPTFPAQAGMPPMLGIDHILTSNSSASEVRTVRIPGTDHLGLTATVHLG